MSFDVFTKDNLDTYLKELAKEYRKAGGKAMPAEILLVGGAAILTNYGFRNMTTDIDAVITASSVIKDAINRVGDKYNLPNGWLNADFMRTASYSPRLNEYSVYYKTFYGVISVRTVAAEYLIAMKLRSGRKYKNDLSDIIGILAEHENNKTPISLNMIDVAVHRLYGSWDSFPEVSKEFIENVFKTGNFEKIYTDIKNDEKISKDILLDFEKAYPGTANQSNVEEILETLKTRQTVKKGK